MLSLGVATGYLLFSNSIDIFLIIAALPITAVIFLFALYLSKNRTALLTVALSSVMFVCGAVACFLKLDSFSKSELYENTPCNICATVCDKGENALGEYLILEKISVGGMPVKGKMIAYLGELYGDYCETGYEINFTAKINKNRVFNYGKPNYYLADGIKYSCSVYSGIKAKEGFSLFGKIRNIIKDRLFDNLDKETASIAYGMLTGNTQFIEDGAMESFRLGGVAHIFAVSGLHIGIVYGLFYSLCKLLKLKALPYVLLCIMPVFLYALICGFTTSSVRAAVMCTVFIIAKKSHKKYDGLNALALSVIIILLINSVSIFSVGFQLSVLAVGGILLLSGRLTKRLKHIPRKLLNTVSVSLSAQAGTLPVMLTRFGYLSGAGLLLNILIVPLLSAEFVILFIITAVSVVFPFASFMLSYASLPLQLTVSFLIDAGFENALIKGFGAGLFLPVYYIGLAFATDKINIRPLTRAILIALHAVILVSYTLVRIFIPFYDYTVTVSAYYGGGQVLIKSRQGNVLIITENLSATQTNKFLSNSYACGAEAVIVLGGENCAFCYKDKAIDCNNIYVYYEYIPVQPYGDITVNYEKNFSLCGIDFSFADGYSITAHCGQIKVGICAGDYVPFGICDLLVCDVADNNCASAYTVSFNERNIGNCVFDKGDFEFYINDGEIR